MPSEDQLSFIPILNIGFDKNLDASVTNLQSLADAVDELTTAHADHAASAKVTPIDADEVPIQDSAATYHRKRVTWANIKATLKTYFDALYLSLTGGTMSGDLVFGLRSVQGTTPADITDDTAISFSPSNQIGAILLIMRSNFDTVDGLLAYRVTSTVNRMTKLAGGANLLVYTGVLTGTTGTDGKLNISAYTDGKIYIENRMGGTRSIHYILLGA